MKSKLFKILLLFLSFCLLFGILILVHKYFYPSRNIEVIHTADKYKKSTKIISKNSEFININSANEEELMNLPNIGSVIAKRIVEYRKINGKIYKLSELLNIKGIGKNRLESIKGFLILE